MQYLDDRHVSSTEYPSKPFPWRRLQLDLRTRSGVFPGSMTCTILMSTSIMELVRTEILLYSREQ